MSCPMCLLADYTATVMTCDCWYARGGLRPAVEPPDDRPRSVSPALWRILRRPRCSEAEARAKRGAS